MSLNARPHGVMTNAITCTGDTYDLLRQWKGHNLGGDIDAGFEIFGLSVESIEPGAQHDGYPALRITLLDSVSTREVGRLVVQHRHDFREELPEWTLVFSTDDEAKETLRQITTREVGEVANFTADVHFDEGEDIERQLAMWAMDYRCNFSLEELHGPAGGNSVVRCHGLVGNAREWLMQVLEVDDEAEQNELYLLS